MNNFGLLFLLLLGNVLGLEYWINAATGDDDTCTTSQSSPCETFRGAWVKGRFNI
jgi:hypothetical protein